METVTDSMFLGSKITALVIAAMKFKDTCSLRKAMTNLDGVLKNRDITMLTKVCIAKVMVFPVVMYRCKSWTIKMAEG